MLWETVLGKMNPVSLNYTILFLISQNFGARGRQEHHQLKIEDLEVIHGIDRKIDVIEYGGSNKNQTRRSK